jgi:hypothetical protein
LSRISAFGLLQSGRRNTEPVATQRKCSQHLVIEVGFGVEDAASTISIVRWCFYGNSIRPVKIRKPLSFFFADDDVNDIADTIRSGRISNRKEMNERLLSLGSFPNLTIGHSEILPPLLAGNPSGLPAYEGYQFQKCFQHALELRVAIYSIAAGWCQFFLKPFLPLQQVIICRYLFHRVALRSIYGLIISPERVPLREPGFGQHLLRDGNRLSIVNLITGPARRENQIPNQGPAVIERFDEPSLSR